MVSTLNHLGLSAHSFASLPTQVKQSYARSTNLVLSCSKSLTDYFSLPKVERLSTLVPSARTQGPCSITLRATELESVMTRKIPRNTCLRSSMPAQVVLDKIGMKRGSRARTHRTSRKSSNRFTRSEETCQRMVMMMRRRMASSLCHSPLSSRLSAKECSSNIGGCLLTSGQSGFLALCLVSSSGSPSSSPTRPCKGCRM